jgi:hypothetical protein
MSVDRQKRHTDLDSSSAQWVQTHIYHLADIPEPGDEWTGQDVPYSPQELLKMRTMGVIKRIYNGERDDGYRYYKTQPEGFEAVKIFLKQAEQSEGFLPCGHDGFRNQGDTLECKRCGAEHDKEAVR